jgi:hypothetical protein
MHKNGKIKTQDESEVLTEPFMGSYGEKKTLSQSMCSEVIALTRIELVSLRISQGAMFFVTAD